MTVLVTASSKHGATKEIADRIGAELSMRGLSVDVRNLRDVRDVDRYEAVVLGSAIYLGQWTKEARRFAEAHAGELARRPTWLFASGSIVGHPPVGDDPNALRAGLADRMVQKTGAREHRLFAGKLDTGKLGAMEKIAMRAAHASSGDHRDWQEIDDWAGAIAGQLRPTPDRQRQKDGSGGSL